MKTAKLVSITVIVDRQTVEIPHYELKIVDGGFEYDDLFVPVSAQQGGLIIPNSKPAPQAGA